MGASTHHCRMLESIGLEKTGGEVLETLGLGSNPSISRKKCALWGHPNKAIRAGQGLSTHMPSTLRVTCHIAHSLLAGSTLGSIPHGFAQAMQLPSQMGTISIIHA